MSEMQNIQWFPGHMTKTKRKIEESLHIIDAVAEIVDARIPVSSRNPDLAGLIKDKPLLILLIIKSRAYLPSLSTVKQARA